LQVRVGAIGALGRIGPAAKSAEPAVKKLEEDTQPSVREAVARALAEIRFAQPPTPAGPPVVKVRMPLAPEPQSAQSPKEAQVRHHLELIWTAIRAHCGLHLDQLPKALDELRPQFESPERYRFVMTHPVTNRDPGFEYVLPPQRRLASIARPGAVVLVYEAPDGRPSQEGLALYADGEIRRPASASADAIRTILVGVRGYVREHDGALPPDQSELDAYVATPADPDAARRAFIDPRTGAYGFAYLRPTASSGPLDADKTTVLYELHGGPLAGFVDGTVKEIDRRPNLVNLIDLRDAVSDYQFHHHRMPDSIEQLRDYFPDDAAWKRATTSPADGKTRGYALAKSQQPGSATKPSHSVLIYPLLNGHRDPSTPAVFADLQLRNPDGNPAQ
jgi:hypothetical protein